MPLKIPDRPAKAQQSTLSQNTENPHHGKNCNCAQDDASGCRTCCTRIEHLTVKIGGNTILRNVNLHIHCGELTAIIGKNGAGKTTFFRALLGEIPHQGRIYFNSSSTGSTRPRFGYVPQKLLLEADMPVSVSDLALACLGLRPVWLPRRAKDRDLVHRVLAATGAEHLAQSRLSSLSGGELQRVMLALALYPLPNILLLDEPVAGIDRTGLASFYELVSGLRRQNDLTVLLISHDMDMVARHADRVAFFDGGGCIEGRPEAVFESEEFMTALGTFKSEYTAVEGRVRP